MLLNFFCHWFHQMLFQFSTVHSLMLLFPCSRRRLLGLAWTDVPLLELQSGSLVARLAFPLYTVPKNIEKGLMITDTSNTTELPTVGITRRNKRCHLASPQGVQQPHVHCHPDSIIHNFLIQLTDEQRV